LITDFGEFQNKLGSFIRHLESVPRTRITKKQVNGILFEFDINYDPSEITDMFYQEYQRNTVKLMKRIIKKGDICIDIGANIGYFSAIMLGCVGREGEVHSFEPVQDYYNRLTKIALFNQGYKIFTNHMAIGYKKGTVKIFPYRTSTIGWNTLLPCEINSPKVDIQIDRIDNYLFKNNLRNISLIKIDTEGYEFPVLLGLTEYLDRTFHRPAIICEVMPHAYPMLGYSLHDLNRYLKKYQYEAFDETDLKVKIDVTQLTRIRNLIFTSIKESHKKL